VKSRAVDKRTRAVGSCRSGSSSLGSSCHSRNTRASAVGGFEVLEVRQISTRYLCQDERIDRQSTSVHRETNVDRRVSRQPHRKEVVRAWPNPLNLLLSRRFGQLDPTVLSQYAPFTSHR
jgi:hypothetical protein